MKYQTRKPNKKYVYFVQKKKKYIIYLYTHIIDTIIYTIYNNDSRIDYRN